ncbi:MAG: hypothetical protein IJ097_03695 [Bacilli bacterium]|nr:hypothetical protein [Bacilli bacterium]
MDIYTRRNISHDNMMQLITVYFREQERDVKARINCNENGSQIKLRETVSFDGITKTAEREMKNEQLEEIVCDIFSRAGQQVMSIINYAKAGAKVIDCGFEHVVKPNEEKQFIVITKEKSKVGYR